MRSTPYTACSILHNCMYYVVGCACPSSSPTQRSWFAVAGPWPCRTPTQGPGRQFPRARQAQVFGMLQKSLTLSFPMYGTLQRQSQRQSRQRLIRKLSGPACPPGHMAAAQRHMAQHTARRQQMPAAPHSKAALLLPSVSHPQSRAPSGGLRLCGTAWPISHRVFRQAPHPPSHTRISVAAHWASASDSRHVALNMSSLF